MKFRIVEDLPNLNSGTLQKVLTEISYNTIESGENIQLTGFFIIQRENNQGSVITEIKNKFPIDITIPKRKLSHKKDGVSIYLNNFQLDFEGDKTQFIGELELSNIKEEIEEVLI